MAEAFAVRSVVELRSGSEAMTVVSRSPDPATGEVRLEVIWQHEGKLCTGQVPEVAVRRVPQLSSAELNEVW